MASIGTRINETGTLIRDGGAFFLRRDAGGRFELELHRVPIDHVEKRVRVIGTLVGDNIVNADGVAPA
ncbi:DUF5818 domain-containing protein [Sphingomonas immobilis]|uniref:DUF5818 domain-containing protein n=1 Tax=Sphingomonas immobilis TaxID=3063997 RepID=A0ABT8ZX01_9SPHN|nr:DUF5818 domain-containing protein [Sphingomonas sp. CA1-15]MDO7841742.1 DUF5818 domain-containing protein [Sphingomonas sp. CA1-15]